jgi:geranylgeranyl diphosphate synthase type II
MTQNFLNTFQNWLNEYLEKSLAKTNFVKLLSDSQSYSLKSGGKRFRPYLASEVYQIWNQDLAQIKNFCLAIEMVHTYSLIHDDLPCMDNDDWRRGHPTNHKVFGEANALLAGDGLLTEAFNLISSDSKHSAMSRIQTIEIFSQNIGNLGMVGGQVLDMQADHKISFEQLEQIHFMKTACLIEAAAAGAALLAEAPTDQVKLISQYAKHLGLAFQIKDDILDIKDNEQDFKSFVSILGLQKSIEQLSFHSAQALEALNALKIQSEPIENLKKLILENQKREI